MRPSKSLANMSVESLLELRDNISSILRARATDLKKQLSRLTGGEVGNGVRHARPASPKHRSVLSGRKVAPNIAARKIRS